MILKAKHHFIVYNFFKLYTRWKIRRCFHKVEISGMLEERGLPVLLIMNHVSWWDGFWALYLNMKRFRRKFYFMMLEEQLRKFIFFNKSGGYSISKHSKSIFETLNYTTELLNNENNLVLLFPQGKIQSLYAHSFTFEQGVEYILKKLDREIQLVFVANLIDYFSNPKPTLYMYLIEYELVTTSAKKIQLDYNTFFANCIRNNCLKSEA